MSRVNGYYYSLTYGKCDPQTIRRYVHKYLEAEPARSYKLIIGTDSQAKNGHFTDFVVAFIVHRVGAGGIYFWKRIVEEKRYVLKARMYQEAIYSLQAAEEFLELLKHDGVTKFDLEIHVDIGQKGQTREVISEIVGMIRSSGFIVRIKPDSYAASKVADRHT